MIPIKMIKKAFNRGIYLSEKNGKLGFQFQESGVFPEALTIKNQQNKSTMIAYFETASEAYVVERDNYHSSFQRHVFATVFCSPKTLAD